MGSSTDAHCFNCGYDEGLLLGAGRSDFKTYAGWPVHCLECAAIRTANFLSTPIKCDKCASENVTPVEDKTIWQGDGESTSKWNAGRNELQLTNGHYRCPKCGQHEMRFGTNASGKQRQILFD